MRADIRADFYNQHTRLDQAGEKLRLKFGKLAITIKRSPHIFIARAVEHDTMAAMLQAQMRAR